MTAFWARYGKTIVAALGTLATALAGTTLAHEWYWSVVIAVVTAAGVHVAPARAPGLLPDGDAGAGLS